MLKTLKTSSLLVAVALLMSVVGCNSNGTKSESGTGNETKTNSADDKKNETAAPISDLKGSIKIDGSSTVAPFATAAVEGFKKEYPQVAVSIGVSGTGGGFKSFVTGDLDISNASRPIKAEEAAKAKESGVQYIEIPVAYDGLSIVVNKQNDWVDQLDLDQLKKIFKDGDYAKTWQDLNPAWPKETIKIFAPGAQSGTFDYFKEVVIGKDKDAAFRGDEVVSLNEEDTVLVKGVSEDKYAIGFFGAAYYFENIDKLKAVKIVNPDTKEAVPVSDVTIESGAYKPFGRPLFMYVNAKALARPEVSEFINYIVANSPKYAREVKYVPLAAGLYELAQTHIDDELVGSHYIDAEGKERKGTLADIYKTENLPK